MTVVRPVIVGLLVGAVVAFVVALLRPRTRSGYLGAPAVPADPPPSL